MNIETDDDVKIDRLMADSRLAFLLHLQECSHCCNVFHAAMELTDQVARDLAFFDMGFGFCLKNILGNSHPAHIIRKTDDQVIFEAGLSEKFS